MVIRVKQIKNKYPGLNASGFKTLLNLLIFNGSLNFLLLH